MCKIGIVEDDPVLCVELCRILELQGYTAVSCEDFLSATQWLLASNFDCVILDLSLAGSDGLSICRQLREKSQVPVMILTSSDSEFDEVMGMNLGADDYMTKPYRPAVLLAHIQALLRRPNLENGGSKVTYKGVTLDLLKGLLFYEGKQAELTRNEQKILDILLSNPGQIITRHELMCELWDTDSFIDDNTLTVNINRVRKVLSSLGVPEGFLQTKRGQGYVV